MPTLRGDFSSKAHRPGFPDRPLMARAIKNSRGCFGVMARAWLWPLRAAEKSSEVVAPAGHVACDARGEADVLR